MEFRAVLLFAFLSCIFFVPSSGRGEKILKSNAITYANQGHRGRQNGTVSSPRTGQRKRRSSSRLTQEEIRLAVEDNNYLRGDVGSSNMKYMTWNEDLAAMAQLWADDCLFEHGQPSYDRAPYNPIGQNLYATGAESSSVTTANLAWFREKNYYDLETNTCSKEPCGHYTQLAWANTEEFGCGIARCTPMREDNGNTWDATYVVCNYGPAGNYVGVKPHKAGPACTECGTGSHNCFLDKLCRSVESCQADGAICDCYGYRMCDNCATTDNSDCTCSCPTGFSGSTCSAAEEGAVAPTCTRACPSDFYCKNGATLYDDGEFCECHCAEGYMGTQCSFKTAEAVIGVEFSIDIGSNDWEDAWISTIAALALEVNSVCNTEEYFPQCCPDAVGGKGGASELTYLSWSNIEIGQGYPVTVSSLTKFLAVLTAPAENALCASATSRKKRDVSTGIAVPQDVVYQAFVNGEASINQQLFYCCATELTSFQRGEVIEPDYSIQPDTQLNMPGGNNNNSTGNDTGNDGAVNSVSYPLILSLAVLRMASVYGVSY